MITNYQFMKWYEPDGEERPPTIYHHHRSDSPTKRIRLKFHKCDNCGTVSVKDLSGVQECPFCHRRKEE